MNTSEGKTIKQTVLEIVKMELAIEREKMGPGDDWQPRIILVRGGEMKTFGIPQELMGDAKGKDQVSRAIYSFILMSGATAACFVAPVWVLQGQAAQEFITTEKTSIAREPQRQEAILITYHEPDSSQCFVSYITRDPENPPKLGPYELALGGAAFKGRFADAITSALAKVKKEKEEDEKGEEQREQHSES